MQNTTTFTPTKLKFKVTDDLTDEMLAPANCALSEVIYGLDKVNLRFGANRFDTAFLRIVKQK
jgi:hypothetical protein